MTGDWADERAREWLETVELDDEASIASLAALLREVAVQAEQNELEALAQQLAEVRCVVEEVRDKWAAFHSVCPAVATEILQRLEAL